MKDFNIVICTLQKPATCTFKEAVYDSVSDKNNKFYCKGWMPATDRAFGDKNGAGEITACDCCYGIHCKVISLPENKK